jgi:hypothetical protein
MKTEAVGVVDLYQHGFIEWFKNPKSLQGKLLYTASKELSDEEIKQLLTKIAMNNEYVYSYDNCDVFESMEFSRVGIFEFAKAILKKASEDV